MATPSSPGRRRGDLGQSTVVFTVANSGNGDPADVLTDQQSINIVVRQSDRAAVLVPIADRTIDQQQALTLQVQAHRPGRRSDPVLGGQPAGRGGVRPGQGRADLDAQPVPVGDLRRHRPGASDGYLTTTETLTINVTAINQPPVLVPLVEQDGREGAPMQIHCGGRGPRRRLVDLLRDLGLARRRLFNTMTGQFNWTPTYSQAGDYTIVFGVSDPAA